MPPSPLTHTTLTNLVKKFLKAGIDSYNSDDLTVSDTDTDQDSLGERARICINLSLSTIYALIKDSKYLEAYPTTAFSSVADQDYVQLDEATMLDDIESVLDTTNDLRLIRRSWSWYRLSDPASQSGSPTHYARRNDRIYLYPRPSSVINYLIDFKKLTGDLKLGNDIPLIPTQYDNWIIAEARVHWYMMEDPSSVPAVVIAERNRIQNAAIDSVLTGYDTVRVSASHFDRNSEPRSYGYQRPVGE